MLLDIRRFDIYRKIPKDLTQPTYTGALISIFCCCFIALLFLSELLSYLSVEIISEMYVADEFDPNDRIPVNIDVTIPRMDCKFIGLDIQDNMGRHEVGFVDNVERIPVEEGQGCRFKAAFKVNKVPGNFHLSTHASREQPQGPDMTHIIHSVVFGDPAVQDLKLPGAFNSLGKRNQLGTNPASSYEYILKIVPTVVEGHDEVCYQYTHAYREFIQYGHGGAAPAVWFRYDLSPISVKYIEKRKPFYSFLTSICAIIGGTFTVAGIIDSLVFTASSIFKKAELGKLS